MEPMGQNLGGAESRETVLAAEVRRLEGQRDALLNAVRRMLEAMREQGRRETEDFRLSDAAFYPLWNGAYEFGEHCLREINGGAT